MLLQALMDCGIPEAAAVPVQALTGSAATHTHSSGKSGFYNLPVTHFVNLMTKLVVGWHK